MPRFLVFAAIAASYFLFAILLNSVGTVILQSINSFDISKPDASTLEGFKDLSIAFVSFLVASFIPRVGYKAALLFGLLLVTLACAAVPSVPEFWMIKLLFACVGTSFALVKVSVYAIIGQLAPDTRSHSSIMNVVEGIFMLGVLSGYWVFAAFIDPDNPGALSWLNVYYPLAALGAVVGLIVWLAPIEKPALPPVKTDAWQDFIATLKLTYQPLVLIFVISVFLYVLIEQGIGSWLPTFNREVIGLPVDISIQLTSVFAIALAVGRLSAGAVLRKMHWYPFLNGCLIAMAVLICVSLPLAQPVAENSVNSLWDIPLAGYLFPLIGLLMAPIYPVLNSVMLSALPKHQHAPMTGLIVVFSALGGTTGSIITGSVFAAFSGQVAFYLALVPLAGLLFSLFRFHRATLRLSQVQRFFMTRLASPNRHAQEVLAFFDSQLFIDVQCAGIFPDSKTFADATPNQPLTAILSAYEQERNQTDFSLVAFVNRYFSIPEPVDVRFNTNEPLTIGDYITRMWDVLTKPADTGSDYSLLPLPHPYIVPGGRFREVYYWDTFFSALGLALSNKTDLVHDLIRNFLAIQAQVGCIPNGNRLYYATRSQPPVLALMSRFVDTDDASLQAALQAGLEHEYKFWMQRQTDSSGAASLRSVQLDDGVTLNRYFDTSETPRPESYREDCHLAAALPEQQKGSFYQHIRAACESGWDFSSRWLKDPQNLSTIRTCDIIPVDLNCLLYLLEQALAERATGSEAETYRQAADTRATAIQHYGWSEQQGYFLDYHFPTAQQSDVLSLAGVMPLFAGIATQEQAKRVAEVLETQFLREGGLVTTLQTTSQQWDSPNGWAPLQWFAVKGLMRYGFDDLAYKIMQRWNALIANHYSTHGVILEKYNVESPNSAVGGGEYEVQLGFGWSNGVYQSFESLLNSPIQK